MGTNLHKHKRTIHLALKILLVLRGGQRKNNITVEFLLSPPPPPPPPSTINNERSLIQVNKFNSKNECGFTSKQPKNVCVTTAAYCSQSNSNCLTLPVCQP